MKFIKRIVLFVPLLFLESCGGAKESYAGKITADSKSLTVDVTKHDYVNGDKLDINTITVKFNGEVKQYEWEEPNPIEGKYFITKSNTTPTASRVKSDSLTLQTSEEKKSETFYVAYIVKNNESLHVSESITITITNSQAMKKWVYWVVGSIVLFGSVALIYFTRKYKHDHPNK